MNKRIVSMIRKLSKTEQEISLTELAEEFQISPRTVRNDLNAIINYPKKNAMPFLERSFMSRSMHTNVS